MKKLFGGITLSWPKLVVLALASGIFTAVMALIPALEDTSFIAITTSFEVWVFFGIFIIMNSTSNTDSALKCFVFFLISQPLVYLIQVPFSEFGWGIFGYYGRWFIWTVLCLPMGFIGYWMKKNKWWGYLILLPMIILTAISYYSYFRRFIFARPFYLIICLFCILAMLVYPVGVFSDKKIRIAGIAVSAVLIAGISVFSLLTPIVYGTDILSNDDDNPFDDTYSVTLEDNRLGTAEIREYDGFYTVYAEFVRAGKTVMTIESPDGNKKAYNISVRSSEYEIEERQ